MAAEEAAGVEAPAAQGGGAYSGGHTMNRTPTMSRAAAKPAASQAKRQVQDRSSVSKGKIQQARKAGGQKPSAANRAELRSQVNRYAQSRPAQNIDRQAPALRAQNFSNKRGNQIAQNKKFSERASQRLQKSKKDYNHMFDRNFFDRHDIDVAYVGTGANWWRPAAWGTLATWGAWNWSTPYYYDTDGYTYPITPAESANAYSSNTTTAPTQPAQAAAAKGGDWLPLGVFAVANNASAAAQTDRFIQLAVDRSGEIAGVLYNSETDTAEDLTGMVDTNSQKAYWSLANQTDSPIASTGIYNLTEEQTPINVHFSDGSDQNWTLVRLQQEL